jgi:hypothetical protein
LAKLESALQKAQADSTQAFLAVETAEAVLKEAELDQPHAYA